jgi:hypothetical protein
VILTFWEFPRWFNDTASVPDNWDPYGTYDANGNPVNRVTASGNVKPLEWGAPEVDQRLTATGGWGTMLHYLMQRYASDVYFVEICNEPNLQWWPQLPDPRDDPDDTGLGYRVMCGVAVMMSTAQALLDADATLPRVLAPALSDGRGRRRSFVGYDVILPDVLQLLPSFNFQASDRFGWSHHNYGDIAYDRGSNTLSGRTDNWTADARQRLRDSGIWTGWPHGPADDPDGSNPYILITEGGASLSRIKSLYGPNGTLDEGRGTVSTTHALAKQSSLIDRAFNRVYNGPEAPGIGMFANYLFYSDPRFDTGLCHVDGTSDPDDAAVERPAYTTWRNEPSS